MISILTFFFFFSLLNSCSIADSSNLPEKDIAPYTDDPEATSYNPDYLYPNRIIERLYTSRTSEEGIKTVSTGAPSILNLFASPWYDNDGTGLQARNDNRGGRITIQMMGIYICT